MMIFTVEASVVADITIRPAMCELIEEFLFDLQGITAGRLNAATRDGLEIEASDTFLLLLQVSLPATAKPMADAISTLFPYLLESR